MIDVKQAVTRASEYMKELPAAGAVHDLLLEELELTDDGRYWLITLSYFDKNPSATPFPVERRYKIFTIDADTGRVLAMKMRTVK